MFKNDISFTKEGFSGITVGKTFWINACNRLLVVFGVSESKRFLNQYFPLFGRHRD